MEFILTTGGRSTSPFETWLKSLKELNDSLLINFDFAENSIKSVAYTNDKTCVKRSAISLEEAGFELQAIKSDDGAEISQEEWIASNPDTLIRLAVFMQLDRFIKVVSTFTGADNYTLTLTAAPVVTEKYGQQTYVTRSQFKSQALTMTIAGSELSEFHIISDDAFNNNIAKIDMPMNFSVNPDTIKMLLSVSSIYSMDVKKDIVDFCTVQDANGEWTLHAIDHVNHTYDFIIAYMQPGDVEPKEVMLPINRNNFILATKSDIDDSTISVSAGDASEKLCINTGDSTKTIIATVRV